jgi:hypothetical protein
VCEDVGWIDLAKDRVEWWALVNTAKNFRVLLKAEKFLGSSTKISLSERPLLYIISYFGFG